MNTESPASEDTTTIAHIDGMHCESCTKLITLRFRKLAGARSVSVTLPDGKVVLQGERAFTLEELQGLLDGTPYIVRA